MLLYSAAVVTIFGVFVALHRHAWKQRAALGLDTGDLVTLRYSTRAHLISMSIGLASIALVLVNRRWSGFAGMIYVLMGPLHAWNGYQAGKAQAQLAPPAAVGNS